MPLERCLSRHPGAASLRRHVTPLQEGVRGEDAREAGHESHAVAQDHHRARTGHARRHLCHCAAYDGSRHQLAGSSEEQAREEQAEEDVKPFCGRAGAGSARAGLRSSRRVSRASRATSTRRLLGVRCA